jgi:protein-tyrosine-phosphatase/DNA-binding transcriptional ArsR family regulator
MSLSDRARIHAALGDPARLRMVDELMHSDRTFQELATAARLPGNAAAHHLAVLESAGLIRRHVSQGDQRRRYVTLRHERLAEVAPTAAPEAGRVLFVCTHNSARSPFAAALWRERGGRAESAGTEPALRVHPKAIAAAKAFGLDLSNAVPRGYDAIDSEPDLIVSVCDRAREAGLPFAARSLHWSVPDPVRSGTTAAFRSAFTDLAARIDRLATAH